jgi:uncharacterized membrane protein YeaQ/YmgE (transglycosylase-associated protein family)
MLPFNTLKKSFYPKENKMSILSWVIFGALAGWIASMLTGRNSRMGCFSNILIGVLGAFLGGFIMNLIGGQGISDLSWNLTSFLVAVGGAALLLIITGWYRDRGK